MTMRGLTRRDILKSSVAAPAAAAVAVPGMAAQVQTGQPGPAGAPPPRERLLLDFGWRFHFGHANDAAKDFGFGAGRSGGFQKTGGFLSPSNLAYDDSDWTAGGPAPRLGHRAAVQERPRAGEQGLLPAGPRLSRKPAWAGTAASSTSPPPTPAGASPSSSTAPTGKPWWSSTATTSAGTAAATIRSAST